MSAPNYELAGKLLLLITAKKTGGDSELEAQAEVLTEAEARKLVCAAVSVLVDSGQL